MTMFLRVICAALALLNPLAAQSEGRSIIVLDASGSMWGQIDGRAKLEIAREALAEVLQGLPADTEMGLMAYGHRSAGDCADIELVVPPAAGTGPAIAAAAQSMTFLGKTPLTEAVRQAALELRSSEEKATVILITDGIETCSADPCALGTELEATGVDFTAHVVGFGLTAEQGATVACLADNTGGVYIQAQDAGTLMQALQTTVVLAEPEPVPAPEPQPAPEPEPAMLDMNFAPQMVMNDGGEVVTDGGQTWEIYQINTDGQRGERVTTEYGPTRIFVEPGTYRIVALMGLATAGQDVTITAGAIAAPTLVLNAGTLAVRPRGSEGGAIETGASVNLVNAAGLNTTFYGEMESVVPAGEITVNVAVGQAVVSQTAQIDPGARVELDIVAGAGLAVIDGYYVEGMVMDTTQHSVEVMHAAQALDGSRQSVTTSYGPAQNFVLPPGEYVVRVTQGAASAEVPFVVKVGERIDVPVILDAGVLAISAPGASGIEVFDGKPDIAGNRKSVNFEYTESMTLTAPAGDYLIVATRGEATSEATATVTPGERTEVTVP